MAERVVVIGGNKDRHVACLEVSVSDASAIRDTGMCRATLSHYSGELANATVMHFTPDYLEGHAANDFEVAWENLLRMPRHPRHEPFDLPL